MDIFPQNFSEKGFLEEWFLSWSVECCCFEDMRQVVTQVYHHSAYIEILTTRIKVDANEIYRLNIVSMFRSIK